MPLNIKDLLEDIESGNLSSAEKLVNGILDEKAFIEFEDRRQQLSILQLEELLNLPEDSPDIVAPIYVSSEEDEEEGVDYGWMDVTDDEELDSDEYVELEYGDPYGVFEGAVPASKRRRIIVKINYKGKRRRRVKCPKGYKLAPNGTSCLKITGTEASRKRRSSRKMVRTKRGKGAGFAKRTVKRAQKANKRRKAMGLNRRKQ